ncbi:hypothetical protein GGR52DRAFT_505780 [Hypoxylon sp. FL1284]|nr:hypothetical protein GGR52DRAFT_505780 [Hypoxylon sp. FL1284]
MHGTWGGIIIDLILAVSRRRAVDRAGPSRCFDLSIVALAAGQRGVLEGQFVSFFVFTFPSRAPNQAYPFSCGGSPLHPSTSSYIDLHATVPVDMYLPLPLGRRELWKRRGRDWWPGPLAAESMEMHTPCVAVELPSPSKFYQLATTRASTARWGHTLQEPHLHLRLSTWFPSVPLPLRPGLFNCVFARSLPRTNRSILQ